MQVSIVIDDGLMKAALEATGLPTEGEVVEAGLRLLVRLGQQNRLRELRGKVAWLGDLDLSRA